METPRRTSRIIKTNKIRPLAFLGLLFAGFLHAEPYSQNIGPFGGINNTDNSLIIPADKAQDALNVFISQDKKAVFKRKGYGLDKTLTISTSAVHGIHTFYNANGSFVDLYGNDVYLSASVNGGSPTVLISTATSGTTWQCVDSIGQAYCANTGRGSIVKTDGTTYTDINPTAAGTMLAVTPDRLVLAGMASNPSRIHFSEAGDFTVWTTGNEAADPVVFDITAPGSGIKHITYAFNRIIWFKDASFGYILTGIQASHADWQVVTIDPNLGTIDNTSVYYNDVLYFRGNDGHIWSYDGASLRQVTQDLDTTINASQSRLSNAWTQSSQAEFENGTDTPSGWTNTVYTLGSVELSTNSAISDSIDNDSTDFGNGSFNDTTSTQTSNVVHLLLGSEFEDVDQSVSASQGFNTCGATGGGGWVATMFPALSDSIITSISVRLKNEGSLTDTITYALYSESAEEPTSEIESNTFSASVVSSSFGEVLLNMSSSTLTSGTSYFIRIDASANCSNELESISRLIWDNNAGSGDVSHETVTNNGSSSSDFDLWAGLKVNVRQYASSGDFTSQAFDSGNSTSTWFFNYNSFSWESDDDSQTLTFELQTATDTSGTWSTLESVTSGGIPTNEPSQYVRYKGSFSTTHQGQSPILSTATITYTRRIRPNATYYSAVNNADSLTSWDTFSANTSGDGTQSFSIRADTNSFTVDSSTPTWTAVGIGEVPSISTGTYFQIADEFSVTKATYTPKLDDFTVNWFEGAATDKSYATAFEDRVWWALASGAGATTNNKVIVYDLTNGELTLFDIPSNGFLVKNQDLYFGSPSEGKIFKYGDTDDDDGSAINAYWKSKDFFSPDPFRDKDLKRLSAIAQSVQGSSVTITYILDGDSSTSITMDQYNANSSWKRLNRNIPQGKGFNTLNVQFGNNATDQYFEIYGIMADYEVKPWIPTQ